MEGGLDVLDFSEKDLKLKTPCGIFEAGPSGTGKTTFTLKLVKHASEIFDPPPKSIVYSYGEYDKDIHEFQRAGAIVTPNLPTEEMLDKLPKPTLLILDDHIQNAKSEYLDELFTKKIHHQNLIVVFTSQNMYDKHVKVARMNSQYIFLMRSPSAALHVRTLGQQLFPRKLNYFMDSYHKATDNPYDYLMIDNHPTANKALRLRSHIFPDDEQTVYIPKGGH